MRGWVCNLLVQLLLGVARAVTLESNPTKLRPYFTVSFEIPQPGGPGPHLYIPQEHGDPVIPPGTELPFVTSYDLQGYCGGILTCLHTSQLPSSGLLCLLGVTVSVLSLVCPCALDTYSKRTLSPSEKKEDEVWYCAQSSAQTERPNFLMLSHAPKLKVQTLMAKRRPHL
jgi:hypothetical protein